MSSAGPPTIHAGRFGATDNTARQTIEAINPREPDTVTRYEAEAVPHQEIVPVAQPHHRYTELTHDLATASEFEKPVWISFHRRAGPFRRWVLIVEDIVYELGITGTYEKACKVTVNDNFASLVTTKPGRTFVVELVGWTTLHSGVVHKATRQVWKQNPKYNLMKGGCEDYVRQVLAKVVFRYRNPYLERAITQHYGGSSATKGTAWIATDSTEASLGLFQKQVFTDPNFTGGYGTTTLSNHAAEEMQHQRAADNAAISSLEPVPATTLTTTGGGGTSGFFQHHHNFQHHHHHHHYHHYLHNNTTAATTGANLPVTTTDGGADVAEAGAGTVGGVSAGVTS